MLSSLSYFVIALCLLCISRSYAECENGCSGRGKCTVFDMCICNRNWMGNDCSQRVCEFGLSFVDTPKGDIDSSDDIEGNDEVIAVNSAMFPYGTTEKFPVMEDSEGRKLTNSAHYYSECSDAGTCNRKTGVCDCFDGFGGAACQRLLCPGEQLECSGHGVCQSLIQLAMQDYDSMYGLWDRSMNRGCLCDKGFYGGDCSMRRCKADIDPLYLDDVNTINYPMFFFTILTTAATYDLSNGFGGMGYFSIKVYDQVGQAWETLPIRGKATCIEMVAALEAIPGRIIPAGSLNCLKATVYGRDPLDIVDPAFDLSYQSLYHMYLTGDKTYEAESRPAFQGAGFTSSYAVNKSSDTLLTGDIYFLQFYGNPGEFQQPEINVYAGDGSRPTIMPDEGNTMIARSWTNGQQGVSQDYFSEHCHNVKLSIMPYQDQYFLWGGFLPYRLNHCLDQADFNPESGDVNSVGWDYGWDHGSIYNPHIIKLVRTVTDYRDGGFLVVVFFDTSALDFETQSGVGGPGFGVSLGGAYRLLHPFHSLDDKTNVLFDVYTTKGTLQMVGNYSEAVFDFASNEIYMTNTSYDTLGRNDTGDLSCESMGIAFDADPVDKKCLDKGDLFVVLDPWHTVYNPPFVNMYRAMSIRSLGDQYLRDVSTYFPNASESRLDETSHYYKHRIVTDLNTNWAQDAVNALATFKIFKFTPSVNSTFGVVAECSNRGICNTFEGICDCFHGYTGDACQVQDALAV